MAIKTKTPAKHHASNGQTSTNQTNNHTIDGGNHCKQGSSKPAIDHRTWVWKNNNIIKACQQGMSTRHVNNECQQGMSTRHVNKACQQGMSTRHGNKAWQNKACCPSTCANKTSPQTTHTARQGEPSRAAVYAARSPRRANTRVQMIQRTHQ